MRVFGFFTAHSIRQDAHDSADAALNWHHTRSFFRRDKHFLVSRDFSTANRGGNLKRQRA
jgi:hypothetical protein